MSQKNYLNLVNDILRLSVAVDSTTPFNVDVAYDGRSGIVAVALVNSDTREREEVIRAYHFKRDTAWGVEGLDMLRKLRTHLRKTIETGEISKKFLTDFPAKQGGK